MKWHFLDGLQSLTSLQVKLMSIILIDVTTYVKTSRSKLKFFASIANSSQMKPSWTMYITSNMLE